jgi:hypothetical protein
VCAPIALFKLQLSFFIAAQARECEATIVVWTSIAWVGFFRLSEKMLRSGIVLAAKSELAQSGERAGMMRIACKDVLKERFGFVIVMRVESELA